MLAIIPSIGRSDMLPALLDILNEAKVTTIIVDNWEHQTEAKQYADAAGVIYMHRPGWNIYKTWNLGIRLGALRKEPVLVLNDDIALSLEGVRAMEEALEADNWAVLGFDYDTPVWQGYGERGFREVNGEYQRLCENGVGLNPFFQRTYEKES